MQRIWGFKVSGYQCSLQTQQSMCATSSTCYRAMAAPPQHSPMNVAPIPFPPCLMVSLSPRSVCSWIRSSVGRKNPSANLHILLYSLYRHTVEQRFIDRVPLTISLLLLLLPTRLLPLHHILPQKSRDIIGMLHRCCGLFAGGRKLPLPFVACA